MRVQPHGSTAGSQKSGPSETVRAKRKYVCDAYKKQRLLLGYQETEAHQKWGNNKRNQKKCVEAEGRKELWETALWGSPGFHLELLFTFSVEQVKKNEVLVSAQQEEEEGKPLVQYQLLSLPSQTLGGGQTPK